MGTITQAFCATKITGVAGTGSGNVIDNSGLNDEILANFLEVAAVAIRGGGGDDAGPFVSSDQLTDAKSMFRIARFRPKRLTKFLWFCIFTWKVIRTPRS